MKNAKTLRKHVISIIMILALMVTGCGGGEEDATVSKYVSPDESVCIEVAGSWLEEDLTSGLDESISWAANGCISLYSEDASKAVLVMQFPKNIYPISGIDDVKELAMQSCPMSEIEVVDTPSISAMTSTEANSCTVQIENNSCAGRILYGETEYAYYFILYAAPKIKESGITFFNNVCESFTENAPEIETASSTESSDTIQWFNNTYAILTVLNSWDYTLYGGQPADETGRGLSQSVLQNSWDVTDRASADETLDWILSEGHRVSFAEEMDYLAETGLTALPQEERAQFLLDNFEIDEQQAQRYADWSALYEEYGEDTISGWDYSRAMSLLGFYYLAGYYTEEESLDYSLEIAKDIQASFDSWDSFMESYFIGYEYWAEEDSSDRREIYEELKSSSDNPFRLDWNMTLEKTW